VVNVRRDFRRLQVWAVFVNGQIDLGESQVANRAQRLFERMFPEAERGTGNKHVPPPLVFVASSANTPPNVRASAQARRFQNAAHTPVGSLMQEKSDGIFPIELWLGLMSCNTGRDPGDSTNA
jgi:hypothetical protein